MARAKQSSKPIHQMTIRDFERMFPDEDACKLYLAEHRWPEFVTCPRCGNPEVKPHARAFHWVCYACAPRNNYRFSVLVGTIFKNSNVVVPCHPSDPDQQKRDQRAPSSPLHGFRLVCDGLVSAPSHPSWPA